MFNTPLQISETLGNRSQEVPVLLELIQDKTLWFVGLVIMLGIVLVAFTRLLQASFIKGIVLNFFSFRSFESLQKNQIKLDSIPSILLLVNYFACLWACVALFLNASLTIELGSLVLWSAICSGGIVMYQLLGLVITAWITGEVEFIKIQLLQTVAGFQFAGIVFLILGIFWFLYPGFRVELFYSFAIILIALISIRFIRGITSSLVLGAPWYYIILYFCTLEILPILVTYYYVAQNFNV